MLFAKIVDNQIAEFPISENELRSRFSNSSLPKKITSVALEGSPYVIIEQQSGDFPQQTKDQIVVLDAPVLEDGVWKKKYKLIPIADENKQARIDRKWKEIRAKRDLLMRDYDWRVSRYNREVRLNVPTTENIANIDAYGQALANITDQADPFLVQFPTLT